MLLRISWRRGEYRLQICFTIIRTLYWYNQKRTFPTNCQGVPWSAWPRRRNKATRTSPSTTTWLERNDPATPAFSSASKGRNGDSRARKPTPPRIRPVPWGWGAKETATPRSEDEYRHLTGPCSCFGFVFPFLRFFKFEIAAVALERKKSWPHNRPCKKEFVIILSRTHLLYFLLYVYKISKQRTIIHRL
jgi:hypothetical protein